MLKPLKPAVLFGVPLVVGVLNFRHPVLKPPVYSGVVPHLSWWITLHLLSYSFARRLGPEFVNPVAADLSGVR